MSTKYIYQYQINSQNYIYCAEVELIRKLEIFENDHVNTFKNIKVIIW